MNPPPETDPERETRSAVRFVLLAVGIYAAFRWVLGVLQLPMETPPAALLIASAITAVGAIALPVMSIAALVRVVRKPIVAVGVALVGLAVWFGLAQLRLPPGMARAAVETLMDVGKITAAAGAGMALASALREPNLLLPAGMFAAFADFIVVYFGTVKHALSTEKGQKMIEAVSAKAPAVHPKLATLTVGPADFLFLGVFLACAARFDLGLRRNAVALAAVLGLSLLFVAVAGWPIPALAPMSLTFLTMNWGKFRLTRQEVVSTAVVLTVVGAMFAGYFIASGR